MRRVRKALTAMGDHRGYGWGLALAAMLYLLMASALSLRLMEHSAYDSYTLQAMTWRSGHISLADNRPWLELAVFEGAYYVSFPPFPAIPMWFVSLFFGMNTPSMLVNFLLFLGSYTVGYAVAHGVTDRKSTRLNSSH